MNNDFVAVYEQSKRFEQKEKDINDVLMWSRITPKLEAGPIQTVESMLRIVKPNVFIPVDPSTVKEKFSYNDPCTWWIVTVTPVCFGWRNGNCKNVVTSASLKPPQRGSASLKPPQRGGDSTHNHCNFRHERTPYIKVEIVSTDTMLKKMKNRTKKLRENGTRNKNTHYINPFTGIWNVCNYVKSNSSINVRKQTIQNKINLNLEIIELSKLSEKFK